MLQCSSTCSTPNVPGASRPGGQSPLDQGEGVSRHCHRGMFGLAAPLQQPLQQVQACHAACGRRFGAAAMQGRHSQGTLCTTWGGCGCSQCVAQHAVHAVALRYTATWSCWHHIWAATWDTCLAAWSSARPVHGVAPAWDTCHTWHKWDTRHMAHVLGPYARPAHGVALHGTWSGQPGGGGGYSSSRTVCVRQAGSGQSWWVPGTARGVPV
jgi:hypothetical protein